MARNFTYVDFTKEPQVPLVAAVTGAIPTAAGAQVDVFRIGGDRPFEVYQDGASTQMPLTQFTPATTGWLVPIDPTAGDGLQIAPASCAITGIAQSFVIGTSPAFYMRAGFYMGTLANHRHMVAGFRKLVAYEACTTGAAYLTAYDEKACCGVTSITGDGDAGTGILAATYSKAASDSRVAATHAAVAGTSWLCVQCNVSAAGAVTWLLGTGASYALAKAALAADTLLTATPFSFTAATEVVPPMIVVSNGTAISDVRLLEWCVGPV